MYILCLLIFMILIIRSLYAIILHRSGYRRMPTNTSTSICNASAPFIQTESQLQPLVQARRKQLDEYIASRSTFFATYGNDDYRKTRMRIANEARNTSFFNHVRVFTPDDLPPSFRHHFRKVLRKQRGGGYWVWKYFVVNHMIRRLNWGDFLIYLDADCTLNPSARSRFLDYLRLVNVSHTGILSISYFEPERYWTNDRLFQEMGLVHKNSFLNSNQLIGGVLLLQKTEAVMRMLRLWKSVIYSDPLVSTDVYSALTTRPDFREHRHDQSVLSLVRKCVGTVIIPNEQVTEKGPLAPLQVDAIKD